MTGALGYAIGVLGMCVGDFEGLTPEEFEAAVVRSRRLTEERWEVARAHACWVLQPYGAKGRAIVPTDLCRFPWEAERERREVERGERGERGEGCGRELSRAELMAEFARVKAERGLK